jgi:ABC-type dipeptide/oligopeptide/nickel transport system permease subunit
MKGKKFRDPLAWIGIGFMVLLVLFAIFGPMIPTRDGFDPVEGRVAAPHLPPGTQYAPLGTDEIGRSFLQRLAYGARISLYVGLAVQGISLVVGVFVGVIGTFAKRWIAEPLMRFTDGMFAFPDLLFAILIIGIVGANTNSVIFALSISGWPSIARITKTQLASLREREFAVAAQASGASTAYLVIKHLLPQMTGILLAITMVSLAGTILSESTLSFLGIGVQSPTPSWGKMVNEARGQMNSNPIELVWPCAMLSLTVFAISFIGDGLRAYFDPKSN